MSEHTPITGELREAVEWEPTFCGPDKAMVPQPEFDALCDAIDAVHAGLERENAELRQRVAVLDNERGNMHDCGRITDELREYAEAYEGSATHASLDLIADRIDAEHESACAEAYGNGVMSVPIALDESQWVKLPVDADGVPIRVGDVLEWPTTHETFEVVGIGDGTLFYIEDGSEQADWTGASTKRHHHAPTVEDVLTEFAAKLIERGELTNGAAQTIADYAAKLRLAGDAS